jgi:hypothetical protein
MASPSTATPRSVRASSGLTVALLAAPLSRRPAERTAAVLAWESRTHWLSGSASSDGIRRTTLGRRRVPCPEGKHERLPE